MTVSLNCPELDLDHGFSGDEIVRGSVYHRLLYTVFQKPRELDSGVGIVVALTSCNRGEGVTFIARQLANELGRCDFSSVACVNVTFLRRLHEPTIEAIRSSLSKPAPRFSGDVRGTESAESPLAVSGRRGPWEGSWQYRRDCIHVLRSEFEKSITAAGGKFLGYILNKRTYEVPQWLYRRL
jgi:hypothetical protein